MKKASINVLLLCFFDEMHMCKPSYPLHVHLEKLCTLCMVDIAMMVHKDNKHGDVFSDKNSCSYLVLSVKS